MVASAPARKNTPSVDLFPDARTAPTGALLSASIATRPG